MFAYVTRVLGVPAYAKEMAQLVQAAQLARALGQAEPQPYIDPHDPP